MNVRRHAQGQVAPRNSSAGVTLLSALKQRQGKIGVASLGIGGGEAVAMAVERL